jgi:polyisoprenoid-binding protein YceI
MMMKKVTILTLVLTLLMSFSAFAKKEATAVIELSPAGSFEAKTKKIKGKVKKKGGKYTAKKITIKVKSLKTGIELRDDHLQKRLNPKKHPKIFIKNAVGKNGKGKALLEMNGIKKKINFTFKDKKKYVEVDFKFRLKDYKIKDVSYMGIGVQDVVKVKALVPLK